MQQRPKFSEHSVIENAVRAAHKLPADRASLNPFPAGYSAVIMSLPDQTPTLPKLPFLIGDAALLGAAWYIAQRDPGPLTIHAVAAVTACVVLAAILGAIPFLTDYARKQDVALDERQRSLEALSRTISTAAEQISIAANGLNELTDLTHKNLKQAELLPHKLQDKIAEFNAQLDNARENDREELEKEVAELRTSETDRLQSVSEKVHKAIGELGRLEAALQQQFSSRTEQVERAHAAFSKTQTDAATALHEAYTAFTRDLASTQSKALAEIDRKLAERTALALTALESVTRNSAPADAVVAAAPATPTPPSISATASSHFEAALPTPTTPSGDPATDFAAPPKRVRKARREDAPPIPVASNGSELSADAQPADASAESSPTPPPTFVEPAPVPLNTIPQIQPVAPDSAGPFSMDTVDSPAASPPSSDFAPAEKTAVLDTPTNSTTPNSDSAASVPATERAIRKRAARKPVAEAALDVPFQLASDEFPPSEDASGASAETLERVISSDGATRLIATSYIGIGNRLFIRGEGPGLSWEKGVPLQFVSIGKWRWETAEAASPINFKLYKNDNVECPGLGTLMLEPGHQQEVTAKF
jgi:hypothetical protein